MDKEIPKDLLEKFTFQEFQQECNKVLSMKDEDIASIFKDQTPAQVKERYKEILEKVTNEHFDAKKLNLKLENLKLQGNTLQKEEKFAEAIEAYAAALTALPEMKNKIEAEELETQLKLNKARAHNKLKQFDQAKKECEDV